MIRAQLLRSLTDEQGTLGRLTLPGFSAWTLEPPWRDNKPSISCIPPGLYRCTWRNSPRFGWTYLLNGTAPRALILIHSGNFGGDEKRGLVTHTNGCILLGARAGQLENPHGRLQRAVLSSKPTVRRLAEVLKEEPFELEIRQPWT